MPFRAMPVLFLFACTATDDTLPGETDTLDTDIQDTDTDVEPVDQDNDGHLSDVDCNDDNDTVYPGATELFNRVDDDCDGRIDYDGAYTGTHIVNATAVIEGANHNFTLSCPTTLGRAGNSFTFTVTCTPDPSDAMAQLLLGETVTVKPRQNDVTGTSWSGGTEIVSSNGWDTNANGSVTWESPASATIQSSDSNFSLTWSGSGAVTYGGE